MPETATTTVVEFKAPYGTDEQHVSDPAKNHGYLWIVAHGVDQGHDVQRITRACQLAKDLGAPFDAVRKLNGTQWKLVTDYDEDEEMVHRWRTYVLALEAYEATLKDNANTLGIGTDKTDQSFYWGIWRFDVDEAMAAIAAVPRKPEQVPVQPWARAYGLERILHPSDDKSIPLIGPDPKRFDAAYAMTTDLTKPVIIAVVMVEDQPTALLIDGTNRLYHALADGVEKLPGYVLTVEETARIRHERYI